MELRPELKELKIFNTLNKQKELFEPLNPPHVGLYVCGPTVYSEAHIGNVRTFTTFDMVFRYLTYLGYKVRYVRNITDVGHLVDDVDEGEDKIAKRARLEQLEPMEIVQKYTNNFHDVMKLFNAIPPSIEPTATAHLIDQIEMIKRILDNGYAYEVNGSVYFDVEKYDKDFDYGILSGRKIEDLIANTRELDGQSDKRNPLDFAIWKKAEKGHIMRWPSPWGEGFPGWHLECSTMSTKYLGKTFDIHGGGMDLKFPHHECEIAQSVGADGRAPVRYWMHGNMLTFEGSKMSKSLGNTFTPLQLVAGDHPLLAQGYSPMTVRFFMLQSHYASTLDFSNDALKAAEKGYQRLMNAIQNLSQLNHTEKEIDEALNNQVNTLIDGLYEEMNDDFNTAKTLAVLFEIVTLINSFYDHKLDLGKLSNSTFERLQKEVKGFVFDVFGLKSETSNDNTAMDAAMEVLIELRNDARANKNWALADKIRDDLAKANIQIKDEKGKTTYSIIK